MRSGLCLVLSACTAVLASADEYPACEKQEICELKKVTHRYEGETAVTAAVCGRRFGSPDQPPCGEFFGQATCARVCAPLPPGTTFADWNSYKSQTSSPHTRIAWEVSWPAPGKICVAMKNWAIADPPCAATHRFTVAVTTKPLDLDLTADFEGWGFGWGRAWTDFNGDGIQDYCRVIESPPREGEAPGVRGQLACSLGRRSSTGRLQLARAVRSDEMPMGMHAGRLWKDQDGDGRADYCFLEGKPAVGACRLATGPRDEVRFGSYARGIAVPPCKGDWDLHQIAAPDGWCVPSFLR